MINKYSLYNKKGLPSLVREGEVAYNSETSNTIFSEDVARVFIDGMRLGEMPEEYVYLVFISGNKIKGISEVGHGGINYCTADPKGIFVRVLLSGSPNFILLHNHPCRTLNPSSEDLILTKKIASSSKMLSLNFLDHIIIAEDTFISLAEEGYLKN